MIPAKPNTDDRQRLLAATLPELQTAPQNDGLFPSPFIRCAIPMRPLPDGTRVWERQNGPLSVRVESGPGQCIPFGQDRAIFVLLCTLALQQRRKELSLGSAMSILQFLHLPGDGRNYMRLAERFGRVLSCRFHLTTTTPKTPPQHVSFSIQKSADLWFERNQSDTAKFANHLTLSDDFWNELRKLPVPLDMGIVRQLLNTPGAIDVYLWVRWRSGRIRPGYHLRVPILGPGSVSEQLSAGEYRQPRDLRRQIRHWFARVTNAWPGCPAVLSSDGEAVLICGSPLKTPVLPCIE